MADAKGNKTPVTGEANDTSQGTSGTSGATGTSATTPTGEAGDRTSAGAVRPAPAAKDTKPTPTPAIKQ